MSEIYQIISDALAETNGFPGSQRVLHAINAVQDEYAHMDFFRIMALVYSHPDGPCEPEDSTLAA